MFNSEKDGTQPSNANIARVLADATGAIIKDLSGGKIRHKSKLIDNIVAFIGTAGGTGTSTMVANVAYMAKKKGLTVLVIDLNIPYPIQHSYFGIRQAVNKNDLVSFLLGKNSIGESIESVGDISVLVSNNRNIMDSINCDNEVCSKNLEDALDKIRPLFDIILIDCPMDIEKDIVNTALYRANMIYTVWDESIACISNMERLRRNMSLSGIEAYNKVRVVFNKRTSIHYSRYPFDRLKLEVVASFPFELAVIEASLNGKIFCDKGESLSKNSAFFVDETGRLTDKILETGGYMK